MKKVSVLAVVIIALSIVAGCKKDATTPTIVGYWTGSTGSDGIEFLIRSNGTVRTYVASSDSALADKYEGTYTEGSDSLRMHWSDGSFYNRSAAAKVNTDKNSMTGTYGIDNSTAGTGTFTATK